MPIRNVLVLLSFAACSSINGGEEDGADVEPVADTERPLDPAFTASGPAEGIWYRYDWTDVSRDDCHMDRPLSWPDCLGGAPSYYLTSPIWTPSYTISQVNPEEQTFVLQVNECHVPVQLGCQYELDGNYSCGPRDVIDDIHARLYWVAARDGVLLTLEVSGDFTPQTVPFDVGTVDIDMPMAQSASNRVKVGQSCPPDGDCIVLESAVGEFPCETSYRDNLVFTEDPDDPRSLD